MMKKAGFLTILFLFTSFASIHAQSNEKLKLFFKLSDYFLKRHVYKGLVNYQYSSKNSGEIDLLHKTIGEVDLTGAAADEKKAFYINAYNVLVIYQVTTSYPLARPLDKEGFFDGTTYNVAGEMLNLNELESERMLRTYEDPRFHFVLACGAISCPPLHNLAYMPDGIEELMEERTRLALNDENFIYLDKGSNTVKVSKIFEWYKDDFGGTSKSTIDFINKYREEKIPGDYKLETYEYDWTLNERT
ncbi:MAG: DUF547 domain-containing protein [Cyclobacteriaceae bacterium]